LLCCELRAHLFTFVDSHHGSSGAEVYVKHLNNIPVRYLWFERSTKTASMVQILSK